MPELKENVTKWDNMPGFPGDYAVSKEMLSMGLFDFLKKNKLTILTKNSNNITEIRRTPTPQETARNEIYKQNSRLFSGYRLVATLDTRTCLVCGSFDGKVFDTEEMSHKCLNENCRCVVLPVIKGMEEFDDDDERASADGPVPAKMTYTKWLKKQPAARKRQILGNYYDQYKNGVSLEELARLAGNEAQKR